MIQLTRLDGESFVLNANLIRYIQQRPDTFIMFFPEVKSKTTRPISNGLIPFNASSDTHDRLTRCHLEKTDAENRIHFPATTRRAKRKYTAKGGVPVKAPDGEEPKIRLEQLTTVGAVIFFDIAKATLTPVAREQTQRQAEKKQ